MSDTEDIIKAIKGMNNSPVITNADGTINLSTKSKGKESTKSLCEAYRKLNNIPIIKENIIPENSIITVNKRSDEEEYMNNLVKKLNKGKK